MSDDKNEQQNQITGAHNNSRNRRCWTRDQKLSILDECEAPGSSVSAVGRKHGIPASVLFTWRKQLRSGRLRIVHAQEEPTLSAAFRSALNRLRKLEDAVGSKLVGKMLDDLDANRITSYNASIAYSNLVNAHCKLEAARLEIIGRLIPLVEQEKASIAPDVDVLDPQVTRTAERICLELVKAQLSRETGASY